MRGLAALAPMPRIAERRIGPGMTGRGRKSIALGTMLLQLAGGLATAAEPFPGRVALWLSPPPPNGRLDACARDAAVTAWRLAQLDLVRVRVGQALHLQGLNDAGSRTPAWTQRCFQLRDGHRVLVQGALVPAESARLLPAALPVLVLENRARHVPVLRPGCGFPARLAAALPTCMPAPDAGPPPAR